MKKLLRDLFCLVLVFIIMCTLVAQAQHINAFTGKWKMNRAKSTFSPGPAPRSQILTFAPDGTFTLEGVDAEGKPVGWSHPWSGGAEVPIHGVENETSITNIRGNTLGETIKSGTKIVETVHAVVSKDGRTLRATLTAIDNKGRHVRNVGVFEKQ
jgi:hypothetical protein